MIISYKTLAITPFTKGDIRRAGKTLKQAKSLSFDKVDRNFAKELANAVELINEWRNLHLYPLNNLQTLLRQHISKKPALKNADIMIGQRIKRLPTIQEKLLRMTGELETMQDIGGIRAVFPDMQTLSLCRQSLAKSRTKLTLIREVDYIQKPKDSGYRGIHRIYKYQPSTMPPQMQGLLIELQMRTLLQHYWATAVESVDMFFGQSLKTGGGEQEWKDFFVLIAAAFATLEEMPKPAPYQEADKESLKALIRESSYYLDTMKTIRNHLAHQKSYQYIFGEYYSLVYTKDINNKVISTIIPYENKEEALQKHGLLEDLRGKRELYLHGYFKFDEEEIIDMVFVSTKERDLEKLYSNYFLKLDDFFASVDLFMNS